MNLYERLLHHLPNFSRLCESPILDGQSKLIGWHSIVETTDGTAFAGGTHERRETARRIAVAEAIERTRIGQFRLQNYQGLALPRFPTSSGFAAGFEERPTAFRSICEGLERWIWSKWIDDGYTIGEISPDLTQKSALAEHFASNFESVRTFESEILIPPIDSQPTSLRISVVIGINGMGAFPGSRVSVATDDRWTHAYIEAYRHKTIFEKLDSDTEVANSWYLSRVKYFGENRAVAESKISHANKKPLPGPELLLHEKVDSGFGRDVFLYRTLFKNFVPWHDGPKDRFVY